MTGSALFFYYWNGVLSKDFCTVRCVSNPSVRRFELHGVRPVFWLSVPGSLVRWLQLSVCWQFELPREFATLEAIFIGFYYKSYKINYFFFNKSGYALQLWFNAFCLFSTPSGTSFSKTTMSKDRKSIMCLMGILQYKHLCLPPSSFRVKSRGT